MTDTYSKANPGFMPAYDGRTDRERELDAANERLRRAAKVESIRSYLRKEQARIIRNRASQHELGLQMNSDFDALGETVVLR